MILRKLIIENFRQIHGRSELQFALPGDRNVTVILGQNGAGKTTILNAFLWCLYGRLAVENPAEIVSHKAVQDTLIGDRVVVEVQLVMKDGNRSYTVSRKLVYQKHDGGRIEEAIPPEFRVDIMGDGGQTVPAPDPKQLIQQLLPEGLSRFFFFRGEDMETLALQSSASDLQTGVAEFLNFTLLDRAIKHLTQVGRDFEAELARIAVGDTKRLTEDIATAEAELADAVAKLDTQKKNRSELERRRVEIERHLAESEATRVPMERKLALVAKKEGLHRQEVEQRQALAQTVSRDGYLWAADALTTIPMQLADEAVKRGEIPAKIKPQFVNDLLHIGECVCGRQLDEAARAKLVSWGGIGGLAVHEEAINDLRNAIIRLHQRRERLLKDVASHRVAWTQTRDDIRRTVEEISSIDSELQGKDYGLDEIKGLQGKLRQVCDDLIIQNAEATRTQDAASAVERRLEELRATLKRLAKDNEQTELIQRRVDTTENVIRSLSQMREGWLTIVQEYLNNQVKENWGKVAQLDRQVDFTSEFHLTIKERGPDSKWIVSAPSSANLRALALCFVSALIKLASEIGREAKMKNDEVRKHQMFQGGDYPLVMDAPFATMDKHFKRTVPRGLRSVVPQMVLLSNYDQWTGEVDDALRTSIGAAFALELHIPGHEDKTSSIKFQEHTIDYVIAEPDAATDWTIIKEVNL
jgi:DNA sulfur modification protein DndD